MSFRAIYDLFLTHYVSLSTFGGLLITSAVKTLPLPGQPFRLYTFLYDWSHQFFNITNNRLATSQTPTPPESANRPPQPQQQGQH